MTSRDRFLWGCFGSALPFAYRLLQELGSETAQSILALHNAPRLAILLAVGGFLAVGLRSHNSLAAIYNGATWPFFALGLRLNELLTSHPPPPGS